MSIVESDSFDERVYLAANPDVASAVDRGEFASGEEHFKQIGNTEGRIINSHQFVLDQANQICHLKRVVTERDKALSDMKKMHREAQITISALRESSSWRFTAPMRYVSAKTTNVFSLFKLVRRVVCFGGGGVETAKKARRVLVREGLTGVKRRIRFVAGTVNGSTKSEVMPGIDLPAVARNDYAEWILRYDTLSSESREMMRINISGFRTKPLISVLMPVYNPPISYLDQAIQSVRRQLYSNWELCIADDGSANPAVRAMLEHHSQQDDRVRVVFRDKNGHISRASNSALALAEGQYVALLDHDDLLAEHALYWVVDAINRNPDVGLIYSDEDKLTEENRRYDPYFKSDFNYELLLAQNMISHLGVYSTDIVRRINGFRVGFEGAQDYDLALRVIEELEPQQIVHISRVLYHWRSIPGSTASDPSEKRYAAEAARKAVKEHLVRQGRGGAEVIPAPEVPTFNRVRFACPIPQPMVSIIIPTRDRAELLGVCLDSLVWRTSYSNYEVIVIDNGSVEETTKRLFDRLPRDRFKVIRDDSPFNFSALSNTGASVARGEILCFMNNDVEILNSDWLEEMVSFAARPEIGCVGARLWYPDGTLQHGGVILGIGGVGNHAHYHLARGNPGYFGRAVLHQSFSVVTGACLLIRRSTFDDVDGFDASLAVAFNDVDLCLRVREAGYRNIWTPYAELIHHESASRGIEDNPEKLSRFNSEVDFIRKRWEGELLSDPAYNPNLTLDSEDFSYAWPPRLPLF